MTLSIEEPNIPPEWREQWEKFEIEGVESVRIKFMRGDYASGKKRIAEAFIKWHDDQAEKAEDFIKRHDDQAEKANATQKASKWTRGHVLAMIGIVVMVLLWLLSRLWP